MSDQNIENDSVSVAIFDDGSVVELDSDKPLDVLGRLIEDGYEFDVRYEKQEFKIIVWRHLPSEPRDDCRTVPFGYGDTLEGAYRDLQDMIEEYTQGQAITSERKKQ